MKPCGGHGYLMHWRLTAARAMSRPAKSARAQLGVRVPACNPQPLRLPLSCLKTIFPPSLQTKLFHLHPLKSGEHPNQTAPRWELWVSLRGEGRSCCSKCVCILEVILVVFSLFPSSCLSFADVNAGERVQTNSVATASASNST